jgi:hypothetical protein
MPNTPALDPFLLDTEQLHTLADSRVVATGLTWFKENRVTDLQHDEGGLHALVEDPDDDVPLATDLVYDPDGSLRLRHTGRGVRPRRGGAAALRRRRAGGRYPAQRPGLGPGGAAPEGPH